MARHHPDSSVQPGSPCRPHTRFTVLPPGQLTAVISARRAVASPPGVLTLVGAILALVSPWTIGIPQVHSVGRFGFELPICWVAGLCLFAALLIANPSLRLCHALAAE